MKTRLRYAAWACAGALVLTGCNGADAPSAPDAGSGSGGGDEGQEVPSPRLHGNVKAGARQVGVDTAVNLRVSDGTLRNVVLTGRGQGRVEGKLADGGRRWKAPTGVLEPGVAYTLKATVTDAAGEKRQLKRQFRTEPLTLDEQTFASVAPLQGETVGVGMPVVVNFDLPVTNKAEFEKHMSVRSTPQQAGSWHWMSDTEAHWRPKSYWKPGTEVDVDIDVNSLPAGNGIYGKKSRHIDFTVGEKHVIKVDIPGHRMRVFSGGKLLRTIPVTTGEQPKYTTRSGTKVIMGKHATYDMNSGSIGIDPASADGYDLKNVKYAMRITTSGEFIHAAPWSVGSQGSANVSHGCTGLSTEDAGWLFNLAQRGDVVEYTGSDRQMSIDNGFGDWNVDFGQYRQGSAL